MDGFVNKGNDFTTFVSNFLNDTYIKYTEDINLYYINSRIIPLGNDLNEFATRLNPSDFKKMGGNRGATKIYELLDTILKATNNNTISFFITDGIFSPGKGKDSQKYINDQYNGIKRIFSNFFKTNPNAAVVVYQFLSPFNGIFYNRHDKPIYKVEEVLPYYIWIIGNIENVKDLMENVSIERIASKGSYKIFTAEGRKKVNYAIKINTGKFDLDKSNPKNTIINLRKDGRNNKVTFAVDVDFSSYVLNNDECVIVARMLEYCCFFFLIVRPPPRSTQSSSSAASDVYKRQGGNCRHSRKFLLRMTFGAPPLLHCSRDEPGLTRAPGDRMFVSTLPEGSPVSYTHLRAHETVLDLVCRLLLAKKNY